MEKATRFIHTEITREQLRPAPVGAKTQNKNPGHCFGGSVCTRVRQEQEKPDKETPEEAIFCNME